MKTSAAWFSRNDRPYSVAERIADGVVHGIGLGVALVLGSILIYFGRQTAAEGEFPALLLYVGSLVMLLCISLAFNQAPASRLKLFLARFDQAAIFLFIAGTYTPFLALIGNTTVANLLGTLVWSMALVGIALKLIVPNRFGRIALVLYLAIGWSGISVFQSLASALPATALWLVLAGGILYSVGVIFHVWERLRFQNVVWHVFVVAGATLHLIAVLDAMVLSRA